MAQGVVYLLPVLLAGIFAFSAITQWVDHDGSVRAIRSYGIDERFARPLATLLPWGEMVLAVALIVAQGVFFQLAAWTTVALMLGFAVLFIVQIARGRRPECHCFGALSAEPISWWSVARNLGIAALAGFVATTYVDWPGVIPGAWQLPQDQRFVFRVLIVISVLATYAWARSKQLSARVRRLQDQVDQLEGNLLAMTRVREEAEPQAIPAVAIQRVGGGLVALPELAAEKSQLLVFVSPDCLQCPPAIEALQRLAPAMASHVTVSLVAIDNSSLSVIKYEASGLPLYLDTEQQAFEALGLRGTPAAVLLGATGVVAAGPVHGVALVSDLARDIAGLLGPAEGN